MNKITSITITLFAIITFLLTSTACQHYGERRHADYRTPESATNYISQKLDLDSNQQNKLSAMLTSLADNREKLGGRDDLQKIYVDSLSKEKLDENYLQQVTVEYIRNLEEAAGRFIADLGSFHATLTEEQRGKLAALINDEKRTRHRLN